jgi:EAL domain-containing protein (putative c-di-GMP-specific phosphodiesterase class I)
MRWSQGIQVGVNVSSRQLARKGFPEVVARILRETGLAPSRLDLEITESCILDTGGLTIASLTSLRKLGVRISIDDFGTGYSSLIALKNLPVDGLKIDRAFVRNLPADRGDATIARALITMATGLGRKLVAEGIETREQMQFLCTEGCQHLQGYLFSRPIPAEEFALHLEAEKAPWDEALEDLPV